MPTVSELSTRQTHAPLFAAMRAYAERPMLAFHTPGHKQGAGIAPELRSAWGEAVFRLDLTELDEVDDLAAPEGVILDAQALAAEAFGAETTFFLINGVAAGLQAMVLTACDPGDALLVVGTPPPELAGARVLAGVTAVETEQVEASLQAHPEARAVLVTSPDRHGRAQDVRAIAALCHRHGKPLLVDETYGAHFHFHPALPPSALSAGADMVVQATHVSLTALAQSGMLHLQGPRVDAARTRRALHLVQSSSPNYVLMASLDVARRQAALDGEAAWEGAIRLAEEAYERLAALPGVTVAVADDPTRLTVTLEGLPGPQVAERLRRDFGVQPDLATDVHVLFVFSPGNTRQDLVRLVAAVIGKTR